MAGAMQACLLTAWCCRAIYGLRAHFSHASMNAGSPLALQWGDPAVPDLLTPVSWHLFLEPVAFWSSNPLAPLF